MCEILPGMLEFTVSDSTNIFVGQGMCNAMKIVGSLFDADDVKLEGCVQFSVYTIGTVAIAVSNFVRYINFIRYKLLPKECTNRLLLQTKCIKLTFGPSILQGIYIWRSSLDAEATIPSLDGYGCDHYCSDCLVMAKLIKCLHRGCT